MSVKADKMMVESKRTCEKAREKYRGMHNGVKFGKQFQPPTFGKSGPPEGHGKKTNVPAYDMGMKGGKVKS